MAPIAVDPNALAGAGVSIGSVADGLAAAMSTLTGSFDANTGQDSAGVLFGQQYVDAAGELLKAAGCGVNACRNVGYGVQVSAANYSRAEANSDISGRSQPLAPPPCPAPVSAPGSPSATGGGVAEPLLWCVVEALIGDLWPNGDPSAMRAAAAGWRGFAIPLHHVSVDVSGAYNVIGAQQMDEAELIQKPIRDLGTGFSDVALGCEQLAGILEQFASDVEQTQHAIRDLLHRLGSIGGLAGTFFEFLKGHGEEELHEIADDIKTVLRHLKAEADATSQIIAQGKAAVDDWALQLESWANRTFVDYFGEHVGSALATDFNMVVDSEEGGFRWLVGTAEGLSSLNPARFAYDPDGAKQTWAGIAKLGNLVTNPIGTYQADPEGTEAVLKGLARTDEWSSDRPMLGLTQNVLDIATLAIPGVGEASAAADAASAAGRMARVADVADEAGTAVRTLGTVSEVSRGARALSDITKDTVRIAEKFDDTVRKPFAAEGAPAPGRPVSLPESVERGAPAVTKDAVRGAPMGQAAGATAPAVERTRVVAEVRLEPVAEPETGAAGVAEKLPVAAGTQTPLSGGGDALGGVSSSGAESLSGLGKSLGGVPDGFGTGSHTRGAMDLGHGPERVSAGFAAGGEGAAGGVGHGGDGHTRHAERGGDGEEVGQDRHGQGPGQGSTPDQQEFHGLTEDQRDEILGMDKGDRPDPAEYLPAEFIERHLERFQGGATRFMTSDNLDAFGVGQRDGTTFVFPKGELDKLMSATGGETSKLEQALVLQQ